MHNAARGLRCLNSTTALELPPKFVQTENEMCGKCDARFSFISFNYDLFLDRAVAKNSQLPFIDYSLKFDHAEHFPRFVQPSKRPTGPNAAIDVLKLHGSLNWARCPQCSEVTLYLPYGSRHVELRSRRCKRCSEKLDPILVPPTQKKQVDRFGIKQAWNKAEKLLRSADRIVVIGYSFPDADTESNRLFKEAVAEGARKPRLTLVDPSHSTRERVRAMVGDTVTVENDYDSCDSFEEYCGSECMMALETGKARE